MHIEEVNLKHELTERELANLARQQSHALGKKAAAEAELGAIKKDFGGRIALAQAEVTNCSQAINTGWEMRNIKCILIDERPEGYRLVVRSDNGHVARRRKLEPHERQMNLAEQPQARDFYATAVLVVDDEDWKTDVCAVPLYEDEFELLKAVQPPLNFGPAPARGMRQIGGTVSSDHKPDPPSNKPGRGRPRKNK